MSDHPNTKSAQAPAAAAMQEAAWWRGAVIYQIYPRSFRDTNDDGVGDFRGCIEGLDYIASLDVDAVWLSPFFKSPMRDFGYDVSDYRDVDPLFGSLADFDAFLAGAHARGLKVVIDQVYSHTSDEHAWFAESRQSRDNAKADWYVWADPKPDGSPPNNWQSVFAGCCWEWDARRRQYFLHNFLPSQPDLNLHNPQVQNAVLEVAKFWLDRGVDGFRLDALNFAMHDPHLRDNPPLKVFEKPPTRPFDFQDHIYNQSHADIPHFIEKIRATLDRYAGTFTVAEVGGARADEEMKLYTAGDSRLNTAYSFDYLYAPKITPALVSALADRWPEDAPWPSWAFSNHDAPRAVSRWARPETQDAAAQLYAMLLMALRGNVFLYQGEELGLPQAEVPYHRLQDPEAISNWPLTLGRDGARTPMPWRKDAAFAGFSSVEPWLPVDARHQALAIDAQEKDAASTLNATRRLIALRKSRTSLRLGAMSVIAAKGDLLAFERAWAGERTLCVFNLGESAVKFASTDTPRASILASTIAGEGAAPPATLPPLSGYIAAI